MKKGIRILALDDSAFSGRDRDALVVGVIGRESEIEGVMSFRVGVDETDSTRRIIENISKSRFKDQIRLIAIHGITFAGLNIIDIVKVRNALKVPVLSIVRRKPHERDLEKAIRLSGKGVDGKLAMLRAISKNAEIGRDRGFYLQFVGVNKKEAAEVCAKATYFLRLAHLIANGVAKGESKGRI